MKYLSIFAAILFFSCAVRPVLDSNGQISASMSAHALFDLRNFKESSGRIPADSFVARKGGEKIVQCSMNHNENGEEVAANCENLVDHKRVAYKVEIDTVMPYIVSRSFTADSFNMARPYLTEVKYFDGSSRKYRVEFYNGRNRLIGTQIYEADSSKKVLKSHPVKNKSDSIVYLYHQGEVLNERWFYEKGKLVQCDKYEYGSHSEIIRIASCWPKENGECEEYADVLYFYK